MLLAFHFPSSLVFAHVAFGVISDRTGLVYRDHGRLFERNIVSSRIATEQFSTSSSRPAALSKTLAIPRLENYRYWIGLRPRTPNLAIEYPMDLLLSWD